VATSSPPLAGLTFTLVGPGRVGASLAGWAVAAGARLRAIGGRGPGPHLALPILSAAPFLPYAEIASDGDDLLLIAVADSALDEVAAALAPSRQAAVALHTSGSRTAEALAPLRGHGTAVGSLHPLKAFPSLRPNPEEARGVFFGLDGDAAAVALGARIAAAWGARSGVIPGSSRLLYHFAATLAAGGVTTLLAAAAELAARLELPTGVAGGYLELARGAVEAARERGDPAAAITGPAARGDRETVLAQLAALAAVAPEMTGWARALAAETIRRKTAAEPSDGAKRRLLDELLEEG